MGAWSGDSQSHVSTMTDGDFRHSEKSVTVADGGLGAHRARRRPTARTTVLKESTPVLAGEVLDAAVMRKSALDAFLRAQVAEAKQQGVLFSVHLKATMMKVSDPIIFGHAVRAVVGDVFDAVPGRRPRTTAWARCSAPTPRPRTPSTPPSPPGRRSRWSTPTAASPTCTCPAT